MGRWVRFVILMLSTNLHESARMRRGLNHRDAEARRSGEGELRMERRGWLRFVVARFGSREGARARRGPRRDWVRLVNPRGAPRGTKKRVEPQMHTDKHGSEMRARPTARSARKSFRLPGLRSRGSKNLIKKRSLEGPVGSREGPEAGVRLRVGFVLSIGRCARAMAARHRRGGRGPPWSAPFFVAGLRVGADRLGMIIGARGGGVNSLFGNCSRSGMEARKRGRGSQGQRP